VANPEAAPGIVKKERAPAAECPKEMMHMTNASERALQLFNVYSRVANLHGYKNVSIAWFVSERARTLFGPGGSLGIPYARVITGYDVADDYRCYCEGAVEELFTDDEARALAAWLRERCGDDDSVTIKPGQLPIRSNMAGLAAIAVGGDTGVLLISKHLDYDLSFEARGFYRLTDCEFDETLPGAQRARRGFFVSRDESGEVDVQDWLLEDPPRRQ
jgi:hypothetical protein